jgi:predicted nucleic acid-binding Zn ribbon protein
MNEKEEDIKEPFCPVCIAAVPLAFSVTAGAASTNIEEKQRRNHIMKWCTIVGIISTLIILYFWLAVKCESCA